jgi:hypothetical protein
MPEKGYTLMFSVVHGNVVGAVIAPRGSEDLPRDQRMFVWRAMIKPLVDEVAQHEEFHRHDAMKVALELQDYCAKEGLFLKLDKKDGSGEE